MCKLLSDADADGRPKAPPAMQNGSQKSSGGGGGGGEGKNKEVVGAKFKFGQLILRKIN